MEESVSSNRPDISAILARIADPIDINSPYSYLIGKLLHGPSRNHVCIRVRKYVTWIPRSSSSSPPPSHSLECSSYTLRVAGRSRDDDDHSRGPCIRASAGLDSTTTQHLLIHTDIFFPSLFHQHWPHCHFGGLSNS